MKSKLFLTVLLLAAISTSGISQDKQPQPITKMDNSCKGRAGEGRQTAPDGPSQLPLVDRTRYLLRLIIKPPKPKKPLWFEIYRPVPYRIMYSFQQTKFLNSDLSRRRRNLIFLRYTTPYFARYNIFLKSPMFN